MNTEKSEESALDSIEHELYNPKTKIGSTQIHHIRGEKELPLPRSWSQGDAIVLTKSEGEKGFSFGAKLLIVSLIFLFIALAYTAWRVVSLRNVVSAAKIDITTEITPFIEGGQATPLILTVNNNNQATLEDVSVTLLYKQGSSSQDEQEKIQEKRPIGTVLPNEFKKQEFSLILYGREAEARDIVIKLEYKVPGSNALFNKVVTTEVVLKTPPISVQVEGPDILSIGQNGVYRFTVRNNSASTSLPGLLQITLPNTFTMTDSSEPPLSRSTSWSIPALKRGESKVVSLSGNLEGKEGEIATIQAKVGSEGESARVLGIVYASQTRDIRLRASPLTLGVSVFSTNGGEDVLKYNDRTQLNITYKNTGQTPLEDVSIVLNLEGEAPLYREIDPTTGYYDSVNKTITWNSATFPDLKVLAPNTQGSIQVLFPTVSRGSNSPKLSITLVGKGSYKSEDDVVTTVKKEWSVQGSANLVASVAYKNSLLSNVGPIPPKANIETTYSLNLKVTAQNALSKAKVSFTLPIYVSWRNETTNQQALSYDTRTKTVTWNIGTMSEGETQEVDVGVIVKPSLSHVGSSPVITSGIVLEVDEVASKARLKTTLSPLTTRIVGEDWEVNPSLVQE